MPVRGEPAWRRGAGYGDEAGRAHLGARIANIRSIPPRTSTGMSRGSPASAEYGATSLGRNHSRPARRETYVSAPLIPEAVEPIMDVFDEGDHILVVAEVPGAEERSISVELEDHTLRLSATGKFRDYRGKVALPAETSPASLAWTLNNGVINLTLAREDGKENGRRQPPDR